MKYVLDVLVEVRMLDGKVAYSPIIFNDKLHSSDVDCLENPSKQCKSVLGKLKHSWSTSFPHISRITYSRAISWVFLGKFFWVITQDTFGLLVILMLAMHDVNLLCGLMLMLGEILYWENVKDRIQLSI